MRHSDMRIRDVINVADGRRLGYVSDLELDPDTGHIHAIHVPGPRLFGFLGGGQATVIPWHKIVRIGPDVVLVDLSDRRSRDNRSSLMGEAGPSASPPLGALTGMAPPPGLGAFGQPGAMPGPAGPAISAGTGGSTAAHHGPVSMGPIAPPMPAPQLPGAPLGPGPGIPFPPGSSGFVPPNLVQPSPGFPGPLGMPPSPPPFPGQPPPGSGGLPPQAHQGPA